MPPVLGLRHHCWLIGHCYPGLRKLNYLDIISAIPWTWPMLIMLKGLSSARKEKVICTWHTNCIWLLRHWEPQGSQPASVFVWEMVTGNQLSEPLIYTVDILSLVPLILLHCCCETCRTTFPAGLKICTTQLTQSLLCVMVGFKETQMASSLVPFNSLMHAVKGRVCKIKPFSCITEHMWVQIYFDSP